MKLSSWCVLALLCLTCFCHGGLSCPASCKCYTKRAEVVCNEVPLTEYPSEGLLKNTTLLTIQFTNITSISEQHLNATPLLQGLHLYSNHLKSLSSHLLRGVPHLNTIDLTGNRLTDLPADVFTDADWLHDDSNLTWLDLSGNQLTKIPIGLTQLRHLSLDDNQLSHIPTGLLDPLNSLDEEGLDLTVNPFLCDGKIEYLWRWLQKNKKKVFLPETITCAGPESLTGRSVMSLTESELKIESQLKAAVILVTLQCIRVKLLNICLSLLLQRFCKLQTDPVHSIDTNVIPVA
uniref:LRRCT domain-containing protein n=1 Tax=Amphiprion percula TaxID=161767 RepID=A0A3P8TTG5_AMPPE